MERTNQLSVGFKEELKNLFGEFTSNFDVWVYFDSYTRPVSYEEGQKFKEALTDYGIEFKEKKDDYYKDRSIITFKVNGIRYLYAFKNLPTDRRDQLLFEIKKLQAEFAKLEGGIHHEEN